MAVRVTPAVLIDTRPALDFDEFYRAEYAQLAKAMYLLTGDRREAEDLAQEALVRAFERWSRVRSMANPPGYVYRTAINLNRNRLRRLAVRARRVALMPADAADPAVTVQDRNEALLKLAGLPRSEREALILTDWVGLDIGQAAEVLGIAQSSVRGRLHRARRSLRQQPGGDHA